MSHRVSVKPVEGTSRLIRRGFTLIELLLVMVILAVLAALVVPRLAGRGEEAKIKAARVQIGNFKTALEMFEKDCSRYPTTSEGLQALVLQPGDIKGWKKCMDEVPNDPWDHPYKYTCPGQNNSDGFDILSAGPDGQEGTEDDITNWKK